MSLMDVSRGVGAKDPLPIVWPLWAPADLRPAFAYNPSRNLRKQITYDKAFRKQITDGQASYITKRETFQKYVSLFSLDRTLSDLKCVMSDL